MIVRFPPKLNPGDLIAVMAPSSGVSSHLHAQLDRAIDKLKIEGSFSISLRRTVRFRRSGKKITF